MQLDFNWMPTSFLEMITKLHFVFFQGTFSIFQSETALFLSNHHFGPVSKVNYFNCQLDSSV